MPRIQEPTGKDLKQIQRCGHRMEPASHWSSSGQQVIFNQTIVDLSNGNACSVPAAAPVRRIDGLGFVGSTEVAGRVSVLNMDVIPPRPGYLRLSFFDLDCHLTMESDLGPDWWTIDDADADRGLLLIAAQHSHSGTPIYSPFHVEAVVSLMDARSKRILRERPWPNGNRFADHGNAICNAPGDPAGFHHDLYCSDVDTGNQLGGTKGWTNLNFQTATRGKRVVLSDYGRVFDWGDFVSRPGGSLKRRVVWDFGSGKELASWRPKSQTVNLGAFRNQHAPYEFAISPDGEFLVEGGAGTLSLYKIGP
jgi:hypothetical protein